MINLGQDLMTTCDLVHWIISFSADWCCYQIEIAAEMIMTLGTVNWKEQETTLSVWQINTVHIFSLLETLDSALRHINPLNFWDKIAPVYE